MRRIRFPIFLWLLPSIGLGVPVPKQKVEWKQLYECFKNIEAIEPTSGFYFALYHRSQIDIELHKKEVEVINKALKAYEHTIVGFSGTEKDNFKIAIIRPEGFAIEPLKAKFLSGPEPAENSFEYIFELKPDSLPACYPRIRLEKLNAGIRGDVTEVYPTANFDHSLETLRVTLSADIGQRGDLDAIFLEKIKTISKGFIEGQQLLVGPHATGNPQEATKKRKELGSRAETAIITCQELLKNRTEERWAPMHKALFLEKQRLQNALHPPSPQPIPSMPEQKETSPTSFENPTYPEESLRY